MEGIYRVIFQWTLVNPIEYYLTHVWTHHRTLLILLLSKNVDTTFSTESSLSLIYFTLFENGPSLFSLSLPLRAHIDRSTVQWCLNSTQIAEITTNKTTTNHEANEGSRSFCHLDAIPYVCVRFVRPFLKIVLLLFFSLHFLFFSIREFM